MSYELRPLSLAEILDAAFRLVQTEWRTLVGLSLLMQIPMVLLVSQASWLLDPMAAPFETEEAPTPEMLMEMGLVGGAMLLAYLILYPFIAGAVTAAVGNFYLGRQFGLGAAASAGFASIFRLVFAYFIYLLAVVAAVAIVMFGVGVAATSIPPLIEPLGSAGTVLGVVVGTVSLGLAFYWGLFAMTLSSLLAPVIVLESKGALGSVSRAFRLGSTSKWRIIAVIFTSGLIVGLPVFGAQMMVGFVPYLGVLIWAAFQAVGFAFTTSVAVVLYFDLRCRSENYDFEHLAEQVEAGPRLGR